MTGEERFSLLLPVYAGDRAEFLAKAFSSAVDEQTLRPSEVVIVQDGPVPEELARVIVALERTTHTPVEVVRINENRGLAHALERGLAQCSYEIVARMDADDISLPERFERQIGELCARGLDLLGAGMFEFVDESGKVLGRRTPPVGPHRIAEYARFHDPFNHPTVIYRRSAVARAGGYQPLGLMEDYWLFARMLQTGAKADNLPVPLVMYRVGAGAYRRRGGIRQLAAEIRLQREFRRSAFTTRRQMLRNIAVRATYRLIPVGIRTIAYRRLVVKDFT